MVAVPETQFPLDTATLVMLRSACEINPDSGHTELMSFLDMGSVVKETTDISDEFDAGAPVYFVEYEDGREPWSEHAVISALVTEILRLRGEE